jgi:hypothetical protein
MGVDQAPNSRTQEAILQPNNASVFHNCVWTDKNQQSRHVREVHTAQEIKGKYVRGMVEAFFSLKKRGWNGPLELEQILM